MEKEIVPFLMDNDDDLYLMLNYRKEDEGVDSVIIKIPKDAQEKVKQMFEDFSKEDIEEEFHYYVLNYVKTNWKKGKRFEIKKQSEMNDDPIPKENGYAMSLIGHYLVEAQMGDLNIHFTKPFSYHVDLVDKCNKEPITIVAASFRSEGLENKTMKEIEKLINNYDQELREGIVPPREERLKEIMKDEL